MIFKPVRYEHILDRELSAKVFKIVVDILNQHKIVHWADFGTLLGIVREGDFIDNDFDIDFGFFGNQNMSGVFDDLEKQGLKFSKSYIEINKNEVVRKANISVFAHPNKFTKIELVPLYKSANNYYKLAKYENGVLRGAQVHEDFLKSFTPVYFCDSFVKIPTRDTELLKYYYGDWKTPRKDISSTYKIEKGKDFPEVSIPDVLREHELSLI